MLQRGQTSVSSSTLLRHITQLDGLNSDGPQAKKSSCSTKSKGLSDLKDAFELKEYIKKSFLSK